MLPTLVGINKVHAHPVGGSPHVSHTFTLSAHVQQFPSESGPSIYIAMYPLVLGLEIHENEAVYPPNVNYLTGVALCLILSSSVQTSPLSMSRQSVH